MRRCLFAACLCTGVACGLNPQPLPPDDSFAATDAGAPGDSSAPSAKDAGAITDASATDARIPDASDASDAQDGAADANDTDASGDADTDGG